MAVPLLYHTPLCCASRAVRLLLGEYGFSHEPILENLWEERAEFLRLNPAGTLPVLAVRSDFSVIGAMAISEYINESAAGGGSTASASAPFLYPAEIEARAEMRRLCDWVFVKFAQEVVSPLVNERVTKRLIPLVQGGGAPDSALLRQSRARLAHHLDYFGWLLERSDWMCGNRLTFADLSIAGALSVLDYLGEIEWAEGDFKGWYSRLKSRPSFRPLLADRVRGAPCVSHYVDLDF